LAPCPVATWTLGASWSGPRIGRSSSLNRSQSHPHLAERRVGEARADPQPLREQLAETSSRGAGVEADVFHRGAERDPAVVPRHHVVTEDRLEHRPRRRVGVDVEVHDLPAHRAHTTPKAESVRELGRPRAAGDHDRAARDDPVSVFDRDGAVTLDDDSFDRAGAPIHPERPGPHARSRRQARGRRLVRLRALKNALRISPSGGNRSRASSPVTAGEWRRDGARHRLVPIDRERLVVVLAERDAQRAAHRVARIGRADLGECGDQRAVVVAGEVGEIEERRGQPTHRLGREDAGARVEWRGPGRDGRRTTTRWPSRASSWAHAAPTRPPPTTTMSVVSGMLDGPEDRGRHRCMIPGSPTSCSSGARACQA